MLTAFLVFEGTPAVEEKPRVNTEKAGHVRELAHTFLRDLHNLRRDMATFSASEDELNSLVGFFSRGLPRLRGKAKLLHDEARITLTYAAPHNPFGDYINLRFGIETSTSGLSLSGVELGRIPMPGVVVDWLCRALGDLVLGQRNISVIFDSVKRVAIQEGRLRISMVGIPDLLSRKETLARRFKGLRDALPTLGDSEQIRAYYEYLLNLENGLTDGQSVSLAYFVIPLFRAAKEQSVGGDPVKENQAALLALLLFAGNAKFEGFMGSVRTAELKAPRKRVGVTLAKRTDLRLHFVYSAGIKILSDSGISDAVGEFKELMDSTTNSGFSFVDLTADMSGVALAEAATESEGRAARLQTKLSLATDESAFFPQATDLPENIPKVKFDRIYGDPYSPPYREQVGIIRDRISRLPAYVTGP